MNKKLTIEVELKLLPEKKCCRGPFRKPCNRIDCCDVINCLCKRKAREIELEEFQKRELERAPARAWRDDGEIQLGEIRAEIVNDIGRTVVDLPPATTPEEYVCAQCGTQMAPLERRGRKTYKVSENGIGYGKFTFRLRARICSMRCLTDWAGERE